MNTLLNRPTGRLLRIRNRLALAAMEHKYRRTLFEESCTGCCVSLLEAHRSCKQRLSSGDSPRDLPEGTETRKTCLLSDSQMLCSIRRSGTNLIFSCSGRG